MEAKERMGELVDVALSASMRERERAREKACSRGF